MLIFIPYNTLMYKSSGLDKDALLPEEMRPVETPADMFNVGLLIYQDHVGLFLIFTYFASVRLE